MRVALYLRVSTSEQTVENQRLSCRSLATQRGYSVVEEYSDVMSGSRDKRPGLQALMSAAFRHEFDAVIVAKLDRIGRSVEHTLRTLRELQTYGIEFISCSEQIDTQTAMGKAMTQLLAMFAELERNFIIERTKAGLARVKAQGKKVGIHKEKKVRPSPLLVQNVKTMKANGLSVPAITKAAQVPRSTVYAILAGRYDPSSPGEPSVHDPDSAETKLPKEEN